jgi:sigma-B regulation protein RsbU (phosphoserine phosphatase)
MFELNTDEIKAKLNNRKTRLEIAIAKAVNSSQLVGLLKEVDSALERIDTGTYGFCEVCHESIEKERLITDPLMRFCINHLSTVEQKNLEEDIELSSSIQKALLPKNNLILKGWDFNYIYEPAGPVSGDYCDILNTGNETYFIVGDVSGKGFSASMLMTHMHAMFHSLISVGLPLDELISRANRLFCESTLSSHYATLLCIKAEENGNIEICNAGHVQPILLSKNSKILDVRGFPLGLFCQSSYEIKNYQLEKGESLLLYSDGITEALRDGKEYGVERLLDFSNPLTDFSPKHISNKILNEVRSYSGVENRTDDQTIMLIKKI